MPTKKTVRPVDSHVFFVLTRPNKSSYSFREYADKDGNLKSIVNSRNNGNVIKRQFNFSHKDRTMKIPINQKDIDGNSVVEFLRNHPECEGSPNGDYFDSPEGVKQRGVYFKELNDGKDAKVAMEARTLATKAQSLVLELDAVDLEEVGFMYGLSSDDIDVLRFKLFEVARQEPQDFLDIVDSKDRKIRALIRKGLRSNTLSKKGKMISWEDTVLGADEDDAVSNLMKDKKLAEAVEKNVQALS